VVLQWGEKPGRRKGGISQGARESNVELLQMWVEEITNPSLKKAFRDGRGPKGGVSPKEKLDLNSIVGDGILSSDSSTVISGIKMIDG